MDTDEHRLKLNSSNCRANPFAAIFIFLALFILDVATVIWWFFAFIMAEIDLSEFRTRSFLEQVSVTLPFLFVTIPLVFTFLFLLKKQVTKALWAGVMPLLLSWAYLLIVGRM